MPGIGIRVLRRDPQPTSGRFRETWRGTAVASTAAFLLALACHAPVLLQDRSNPFARTPVADAQSYDEWARRIAADGLSSEPVFHQAPLFPVLLSLAYRDHRAPGPPASALLLQAVATSLALCLLVPLGRLYLGSTAAGALGFLLALLHAPFVFYSLKLLPTPLALASQAAALVLLGFARARGHAGTALAAGIALGIAGLARAEILLFAPVGAAALGAPPVANARRGRLLRAGLFLLGTALAVAPATVHNALRGDVVLVASSGGENLFIGNRQGARGDYSALHPQAGDLFSERLLAVQVAQDAEGRDLAPSEVSRWWRRRALEEILANPVSWARLEARKLGRVLHPGDPTDIYSLPLERSSHLSALWMLPLPSWPLLAAGLAGLWLALRRQRALAWPLAAAVALQTAVLLAFFVNTRLRLPLLFVLAPFGGLAVLTASRDLRDPARRRTAALGLCVAAALTFAGTAMTRATPRDRVRLASVLSTQERFREALDVLAPVLSGPAPYPLALDQAGWVLQKMGDLPAARDRYRAALESGMPEGRATSTRTRLAVVLDALGDAEAAAAQHDAACSSPAANAGTYFERGMFRLRRGDEGGAAADLAKAAELDPTWPPPREALGRLGRAGVSPRSPDRDGAPGGDASD